MLTSSTQWVYEGRLLHTAAWGNHQTSLTAVFQAQQANSNPNQSLFESIEHRNLSFSMRGTYGYMDRYFLEASFGYNGSERFAKKNRMGFFPICWRSLDCFKRKFHAESSQLDAFLQG